MLLQFIHELCLSELIGMTTSYAFSHSSHCGEAKWEDALEQAFEIVNELLCVRETFNGYSVHFNQTQTLSYLTRVGTMHKPQDRTAEKAKYQVSKVWHIARPDTGKGDRPTACPPSPNVP